MSPKLRIIFRIIVVFLVCYIAMRPYNWYCQITQKCSPFYFSSLIPKSKGSVPINIVFYVTNYKEDIEFSSVENSITTVANKRNIVRYKVKNLSKKKLYFKPKIYIEPRVFQKYIKKYHCICDSLHKLNPNQELDLKMDFEIDKKIENDESFKSIEGKKIEIRYEI